MPGSVTVKTQPVYGLPSGGRGPSWEVSLLSIAGWPLAWYRMVEPAGTSLLNSGSGAASSLALSGGYTFGVTGPRGLPAILFDGSSGYANMESTAGLPIGAAARTTSLWFKTTRTSKQVAFNYGAESSGNWWCHMFSDGSSSTLGIGTYADDHLFSAPGAFDGNWHWEVITYDGALAYVVYLDGAYLGGGNFGSARNTGATRTRVAQEMNGGNYFSGTLGEIAIWNSALTPSQVAALYRAGT